VSRVEKNPGLKKNTHLFFKKKNVFFGLFEKKQGFVLFLRKMEKPYS